MWTLRLHSLCKLPSKQIMTLKSFRNIAFSGFATLESIKLTWSMDGSEKMFYRLSAVNSLLRISRSSWGALLCLCMYSTHVGYSWGEDQRSPMKCDLCGSSRTSNSVRFTRTGRVQTWSWSDAGITGGGLNPPFSLSLERFSLKSARGWFLLSRGFGWKLLDGSLWINMCGDFSHASDHFPSSEKIYEDTEIVLPKVWSQSAAVRVKHERPLRLPEEVGSVAAVYSFIVYERDQVSCWVETFGEQ